MEATEPLSVEQAAETLLSPVEEPEQAETEAEDAPQEADAEGTEPEEVEAAAEDEADDAEEAEEAEDDAEQDADDEEADADLEEPQPETYTVKVDGQEVAVTLDDLKRSYSGQQFIQKGMREAAEVKKQAEAEAQTLQQERAALGQLVQQLQQGGLQPPQKPPAELLETDPLGYLQQQAKYEEENGRYQAQVEALNRQTAAARDAEMRQLEQFVNDQARILQERYPEIADPQKAKAFREEIVSTATTAYGFSEEELSGIVDARHVQVLRDAAEWRKLQAGKQKVAEKAKKARPVVKPSAKKARSSQQKQRDNAKARLRQTGRIDDALALIMENPE